MTDLAPDDVAVVLRRLVGERLPVSMRGQAVADDLPLGSRGAGLDSIGLVELLLDCEAALGLPFPAEVFDNGPLTVARLITHAERTRSRLTS